MMVAACTSMTFGTGMHQPKPHLSLNPQQWFPSTSALMGVSAVVASAADGHDLHGLLGAGEG